MTIGIDASRSVSTIQKTGVELVSDELLSELQTQLASDHDVELLYYAPQKIDWLPAANQRILRWPFKFLWTQARLAWELIFHPPEHIFFPVHAMPLLLLISYKLRAVNYFHIIHDIACKKQPQLYSFKQKIILNLDLWLTKKLCAKIFVPTDAVRQDLIRYAKIHPEKIVVTPWGYKILNNEFRIMDYGEKKKQILYLGRVEAKKNIINLIKAFNIFSKKHADYKLILAGKIDPKFQNDNSLSNIHNSIEFLNYVSEQKKHELLRESACLVLVSREEGFGFPILEAFDFGLPVIASDIPVLYEIGGDACLYADPNSPQDIADKLEQVIADQNLASQLTIVGHERLSEFSWPKTAEQILREMLIK